MDENKGGEFIRNLAASGWASVNRSAMDDTRLNVDSKGVLAWLLTRPDGHRLYLFYMLKRLGIGQQKWGKIRNELVENGYLKIDKKRVEGKFRWNFQLTDTPSK